MINQKTHPELHISLNEMTTLLSKEHTEKQWKWSVLRVLRAMAEELATPLMIVNSHLEPPRLGPVKPGPADDGGLTMKKIVENIEKRGPPCPHAYSRAMDQVYPRKCVSCGEPEHPGPR